MDADRLQARVAAAPPNDFLPLITLKTGDSPALASRIQRIKDISAQHGLAVVPALAPEFVGDLGPATSERLQQVGAPYQPGDTIGISGLQLSYQRQLASIPEVDVVVLDAQGRATPIKSSYIKDTAPPQTVNTTIDSATQRKAEKALAGLKVPASMVALRPSTGDVLAVANRNTGGEDRALTGKYAPGMAFGIVSAGLLLKKGQQRDQKLDCPAAATVGGQSIGNPSGAKGTGTFETDFARGCGTTLATLSSSVSPAELATTATEFGLGRELDLTPIQVYSGSVPAATSDATKAQEMIGQGGVTVSPLTMAAAAGAVNSGTWRPPRLVQPTSSGATGSVQQTPPQAQLLDPSMVGGLEALLHRAATFAGKSAGLSNVYGISAQADQGNGKTVSWFVGYRDQVAFAVAIEGKVDAAAVVAKFLHAK